MDDDEHKTFGKTWLDSSETKIKPLIVLYIYLILIN